MFRRREGLCFLFLATCRGSHLLTYTHFFVMMKLFSILKLFQTYVCVCVRACACHAAYVVGRGPVGVSPLLTPCGSRDRTQVVTLSGNAFTPNSERARKCSRISENNKMSCSFFPLKFIFLEFQAITKLLCYVFSSASPSVLLYLLVLCLTEHGAHWFA